MPVKNKESLHAHKLRELGFNPIPKEVSMLARSILPRQLSRNERRLLEKQRYKPWFTKTDIMTWATDETGQSWQGPPNIDISALGFDDKSAETIAGIKAARAKDRRYN